MKIQTLKSETRGRGEQEFGARACKCARLVCDNEHWHHLTWGYWPQITSAINHQALLPNADGLGRKKKNVLSRHELLSSNFARVENKTPFPPCIWDVRNWSALWRGRNILEHCSERKRGIHLWVVQEELLFSAPWPFRITVCPWPVLNLPSTRSIQTRSHRSSVLLISAHLKGLFLVRHCKHWDPTPAEQIMSWKTLWSLQQLLPSKAFCKVRVPETKILSSLVFHDCDNFHACDLISLKIPPSSALQDAAHALPQQLNCWEDSPVPYRNMTNGKQSRVRT